MTAWKFQSDTCPRTYPFPAQQPRHYILCHNHEPPACSQSFNPCLTQLSRKLPLEAEPRRQYCKFGQPSPRPLPLPTLPTSSQARFTVPPPRSHPPPPPPSLGPPFTSSFTPDLHLASYLCASLILLRLSSHSSDLGFHVQERPTISTDS